ncbi:MAG TPA: MFS transporter [Dongiaceae bacterium]|nr:MFS transporter [Dongiaceae bacterium]
MGEGAVAGRAGNGGMLSLLRGNRDFCAYTIVLFLSSLAAEILTVAVGWKIYDISGSALDLGLVGLVEFLPSFVLVFITGTIADLYSRRTIVFWCLVCEFTFTFALFLVAGGIPATATHQVWPMLALIAGLAVGRAFLSPAAQAMAPNLVRREEISTAIACSTVAWQLSVIAGPAMGGVLYGIAPAFAYITGLVMVGIALCAVLLISRRAQPRHGEQDIVKGMIGGLHYMLKERVVLGASTLDLFAVLFGSVTTLLPIYARDILVVGPWGLGLLRAGMGMGALLTAVYLGFRPLRRRAGPIMFATVGIFGLATVALGLSRWLPLSILALIIMGASDMVSVYIREVLIQLWTPDHLRGRVTALYGLGIIASNELGGFRAGLVASLIGAVQATILGGGCTLAVAGLWMHWFPKLRRQDQLSRDETDA